MARDYCRILTAIWRNKGFRALDEAGQRLYFLLATQEEISAVGLLPLRVRRWAEMAADTKPEAVTDTLRTLDSGKFIVVDFDTEEVLVRAFVRIDGGFTNSKRRPVIIRAAAEVASVRARRTLAAEFARCGLPTLEVVPDGTPDAASDGPSNGPSDGPSDAAYTASPRVVDAESSSQVDAPSDATTRFDGVVVTDLGASDTATPNEKNTEPSVPRGPQLIIGEWLDSCRRRPPSNVVGQVSKGVKGLLDEGIDPDDVRGGLELWASKGLHPSALPAVVNELMNSTPARPPDRPSEWQGLKADPRLALPGGKSNADE